MNGVHFMVVAVAMVLLASAAPYAAGMSQQGMVPGRQGGCRDDTVGLGCQGHDLGRTAS